MRDIKDGGPAFPTNTENVSNAGACYADAGMTLRDYFAAKAMQGYLASFAGGETIDGPNSAAEWAYRYADAMLRAREA